MLRFHLANHDHFKKNKVIHTNVYGTIAIKKKTVETNSSFEFEKISMNSKTVIETRKVYTFTSRSVYHPMIQTHKRALGHQG